MMNLFSDLGTYLQAVFLDGIQKIFTSFDLLGLVICFLPEWGKALTLDPLSARKIGIGIILGSFLLANFSLCRKSAGRRSFLFEGAKAKSVARSGDWLTFQQGNAGIPDRIALQLVVLAHISNSGPATSVRFFVDSLEPCCLASNASLRDIEVDLRHQVDPRRQATRLENPYYVKADEMRTLQLSINIPFDTRCLEKKLGSLSSFTRIDIKLGAQPTGLESCFQSVACDLDQVHKAIDDQIAKTIGRTQSSRLTGSQVLGTVKRYWAGHSDESDEQQT